MDLTVAFATFGCKVNQYDTQAMLEAFAAKGYRVADFSEPCDVYVINTCTVTGTAANKSLRAVRGAAQRNPAAAIVVAGCVSQERGEELLTLAGVRLVLGTANRARVADLLADALERGVSVCAVEKLEGQPFEDTAVTSHEGHTRAVLKIQEGCENRCAYCAIPGARGPVRSRPLDSVRAEAERLGNAGFREVVLTGIHLCSYGRDLEGVNLLDAIGAVCEAEGVARVRLSSLEPSFITREVAERFARTDKLCAHFHLSLQSGSDSVLKRMRRRYTADDFRRAVGVLRGALPGCAVTTDVICGFPGEDERAFEETLAFSREIGFSRMHVFPYSERAGTDAAGFPDSVPVATRRARANQLIALAKEMEGEYAQSLVGSEREVLFEKEGYGLTREYVAVRAPAGTPGEISRVFIAERSGVELWSTQESGEIAVVSRENL